MQSTAVQTKTRSTQNLKPETTGTVTGKKDNTEFADPFLQIIMNLLTQTFDQNLQQPTGTAGITGLAGTDQSSNLAALLQNMPSGMASLLNTLLGTGSNTDSNTNLTDVENASVLLEALAGTSLGTLVSNSADASLGTLASNSADTSLGTLASNSADTSSLVPIDIPVSTGIGTDILSSLYSDQISQSAELSNILSLLSKGTDSTGTTVISSDALTQLTDLLGLSGKDELQSALKNAGIEILSSDSTQLQNSLSVAILKAKQILSSSSSQQTDDSKDFKFDIDSLQNELSKSNMTTPFELRFKQSENIGDVKVLEQLTDGIKQNISLGKSEFTIKLKPESLGEITVKLIEDAGKTTLSITTASAQTAKLINNDIEALKQAVAPMNVEVHNAVVSTNETANGSMQQFNMSGQQFAGQQFAGHQSFFQMSQAASRQSDNQVPEDVYASSQAAQVKILSGDRLDAYV